MMHRELTRQGYIRLLLPGGRRIAEHRWVVEQWLGRPLFQSEHVHHRNKIRDDNRLENLQIITLGAHNALHVHERFPAVHAGRWTELFDQCVECGKNDKPHAAKGRCARCYDRDLQRARRIAKGTVSMIRRAREHVWSVDRAGNVYYACVVCGRNDRQVYARGECGACASKRQHRQ